MDAEELEDVFRSMGIKPTQQQMADFVKYETHYTLQSHSVFSLARHELNMWELNTEDGFQTRPQRAGPRCKRDCGIQVS